MPLLVPLLQPLALHLLLFALTSLLLCVLTPHLQFEFVSRVQKLTVVS